MENLMDHAIRFATKAHDGQYRKASNVPYISHPFSVGMILARASCTDDMIVAGILHDVVEDTKVTLSELADEFGKSIADIVAGCSEPDKTLSWKERKDHTLEYLKTAPIEIKIVTAADKLHNIRSIIEDRKVLGEAIWERFNKGKTEQAWYYKGIINSIYEGLSGPEKQNPILKELESKVHELFG